MERSHIRPVTAAGEGPAGSAADERHTSGDNDVIRTSCGRELRVGRLCLHELGRPVSRVTLDINCEVFDRGEVWASLTSDEARRLAGRLLAHAAQVDREAAGSAVPEVDAPTES